LSTHNLFCRKFAAVVGKLQLSAPFSFLTDDAADIFCAIGFSFLSIYEFAVTN